MTEIIKTRSATAAQKIADERGLAEGSYTITKVATAKYELVILPRAVMSDEPITPADHAADCEALVTTESTPGDGSNTDRLFKAIQEIADEKKPAKTKTVRVNRHWNDDGSLTLYVAGIKLRRIGGDEDEEIEDTEEFAETYLNKKYLKKTGGWVWGRTTQGHNWHTKRQKALRARIAAGQEAGEDVSALEAELAKIGGR
jgi:hypothetical protein